MSCPDGAVAAKHDKHFQLLSGRFCKGPLHLICPAKPGLGLDDPPTLEDIEYLLLGFQIAASA